MSISTADSSPRFVAKYMYPSQSVPLSHDCRLASPDKHVDQSMYVTTATVTVTQDKKETGTKLATNVATRL